MSSDSEPTVRHMWTEESLYLELFLAAALVILVVVLIMVLLVWICADLFYPTTESSQGTANIDGNSFVPPIEVMVLGTALGPDDNFKNEG